tara:strand:- start:16899 stop:17567 length:669 start_codon:yes stop_codon:yes gene_type:complete
VNIYKNLSKKLNYDFNDLSLLENACAHKSSNENDNERLEFLGDAVLGCVISHYLFKKHPMSDEGMLSLMKSHLVSKKSLAIIASELHLGEYIQFNHHQAHRSPAVLANSLEAIFGAIFIDSDLPSAEKVILFLYQDIIENMNPGLLKNPKNILQEKLQKDGHKIPEYELKTTTGHQHKLIFIAECILTQHKLVTEGKGSSKKAAEEDAASEMLRLLDQLDNE